MKRIFTILASFAAAAFMLSSCTEKVEDYSNLEGVYAPSITMEHIYVMLPETSQSLTVKAVSVDDKVAGTPMKVTFSVNPDLVAVYNAANDSTGIMLPSAAFELGASEVIMPRFGKASSSVSLRIICSGLEDNQLYVLPVVIDKISGDGKAVAQELTAEYVLVRKAYVEPGKGSGTKDDPWIISEVADLEEMSLKLVPDKKVYFKLTADLDLSSIPNWTPLNVASPYNLCVDFNGNGHTISNLTSKDVSYASMFGVLYGDLYDLNFENADISGSSAVGVIGGYLSTGTLGCTVRNVHVKNSKVNGTKDNGVGGLGGRADLAVVENSSFEGSVTSIKNYVGGIVGRDMKQPITIKNCYVSGAVQGDQRVGGIVGAFVVANSAIYNSYCNATVDCSYGCGGIVGNSTLDKSTPLDVTPNNVFEKCIAWNPYIKSKYDSEDATFSHYSIGAVVGYTAPVNTGTDCVRRPDMVYKSYTSFEKLEDQPNFSPTSPLSVGISASHHYPYNGVAAAAGKTLSDVARDLKWSADIWDLSGDVPVFKK